MKYPYFSFRFGYFGKPINWKGIQISWKPFKDVKPYQFIYEKWLFIPLYKARKSRSEP